MRICVLVIGTAFSVAALAGPPTLQDGPATARLYDLATREAQFHALSAIPGAEVQYGSFGRLKQLDGPTGIRTPQAAKLKRGDSADLLFQNVKRMLLATGTESLVVRDAGTEPFGSNHFVFTNQIIDGIPVVDVNVNFLLDPNGEIKLIASQFVPQGKASSKPQMPVQIAKAKLEQVLRDTGIAATQSVSGGSLAFWTDQGTAESPRLLWMFEAGFTRFGVDATTGELRYTQKSTSDLDRTVYTNAYRAAITPPPSSNLLWVEGSPNPGDAQAFSIYERVVHPVNAWQGFSFAYDVMRLVAHWGSSNNAAYANNGTSYLFFSDQRAFDDDAIAHEYGHGLFWAVPTRPGTRLKVWDEWFAGNEFYGDLSAVMTEIYRVRTLGNETWAISDLRDWRDPKSKSSLYRDWYPDRAFLDILHGVSYVNSTIFGHAVFLMINGGEHRRAGTLSIDGYIPHINVPPADAGQIKSVLSYAIWLMRLYNSSFDGPAYKTRTMEAAEALYGPTSGVLDTVERAWTAVGIDSGCSGPPAVPVITEFTNHFCMGEYDISWQQLPGLKYHAETAPAAYGFDYATTTVDGPISSCSPNVPADSYWRLRACNGCGCSEWTAPRNLRYYRPCL